MSTPNRRSISRPELSRRSTLQLGLLGAAGVLVGYPHRVFGAAASSGPAKKAQAKSVIQIWMWGGPTHIDTFDPKPDAGYDYCGPLNKAIPTNVDGIRIGQLLPLLAAQADKYSLIRSMTHGVDGHETASYEVQTGRKPGDGIVYPSIGAVVSLFKGTADSGYRGLIPPYIVLTQLQGRFSEVGFLGSRCKPFATGGDPAQTRFVVEGVVGQGITDQRQRNRRDLLAGLNTFGNVMKDDSRIAAMAQCDTQAYEVILGDAGKVFDLSQEKADARDRYGRTTFGQSCLMARRLVEHGTPYVTINYQGWDTHKQHFPIMSRKLPEFDKGLATLLVDLSERGLLDSTVVWCCGEFGRTPKVMWEAPWNGGRNHFGQCFSALVAGGGFKGGHVLGASNATAEAVVERPVSPAELLGAIYERMGIDPDGTLPHPSGKLVPITAPSTTTGGRLKELV
jgi:uncharacterized protein (DUF1501 family)